MAKLKLSCVAFTLLLLCFSFSSYFALTALARLYSKSLNTPDLVAGPVMLLKQLEIDIFINQQLFFALLIFLSGVLIILAMVFWRMPQEPEQWSLKKVGWPLSLVSSITQLLVLGIFIINFTRVAPAIQVVEAGLFNVIVEVTTTLIISTLLFIELLFYYLIYFRTTKYQTDIDQPPLIPANSTSYFLILVWR